MVDQVVTEFPSYLRQLHSSLIDWTPTQRVLTHIQVKQVEDTWLVKVHQDKKCPVCGTPERSIDYWCDPRPESAWL